MRRNMGKQSLGGLLAALTVLTVGASASAVSMEGPGFIQTQLVCVGEVEPEEAALLDGEADLEGTEKALYQGIEAMEESISLSQYGVTGGELDTLIDHIRMNCPELFMLNLNGTWSYSRTGSTGIVVEVYPPYQMKKDEYDQAKLWYDSELAGIVAQVHEDWSDLEKVLFVHDYLAANYEYDFTYSIYDAYHFLKEKTGVCQAYTMTFTAVMQELGIGVSYVESSALSHIWNLVELYGNWYHIDVTFDDPTVDRPGYASHQYFLRSDSGLTGHEAEKGWVYGTEERAEDTTYDDYFWKNTSSPFVYVDGTWYFIESDSSVENGVTYITASRLMSWDNGDGSNNRTIASNFQTGGAGLGYFAGKLYFNTFYNLYSYDLSTGEKTVLLSAQSYIYGCRLETTSDGRALYYRTGTDVQTYLIDPYASVTDGGYEYYQHDGSVYLRLDGTSCVVAAWYEDGRMVGIRLYTEEGEYEVAPGQEATEVRVIAVGDVEAYRPLCGMLSLAQ